jgi:hypothetical protein
MQQTSKRTTTKQRDHHLAFNALSFCTTSLHYAVWIEEPDGFLELPGSGVWQQNYSRQKHYASNIQSRLMISSIIMKGLLPKKTQRIIIHYLPITKDCET